MFLQKISLLTKNKPYIYNKKVPWWCHDDTTITMYSLDRGLGDRRGCGGGAGGEVREAAAGQRGRRRAAEACERCLQCTASPEDPPGFHRRPEVTWLVFCFLSGQRAKRPVRGQRLARRCLILSDVWQPTVSRVWWPTAASWQSAAASDCQEEWMWSKFTRDNVRRIQKKVPSGTSGNDVVPSWHRAVFLLPSSALALHLILVFNRCAVGFTSAAGPRLAAAGGSWRGACWVAWTHVWRCENLWTRPLGLKHILGGWAHSHAVLNWETRKSGTCAQTCEPIWAEVTGDTSLHGNVRHRSTRKYCGAEESGRHKMARKMWKMLLRMIKKENKHILQFNNKVRLQ